MNKNMDRVQISGIRKFYNKVSKIEGAISLTLGQPDFPVPIGVKHGMIQAIEDNKTTYTANNGIIELRKEISLYLKKMNLNYNPEEICVTVGGSEALFSVIMAIINNGDKILIPTPAYPAYEGIVNMVGGEVVNYKLKSDFSLDLEDLKEKIESGIKYLILSFPSNPTGAILSKGEMDKLSELIEKYNVTVITDEIYSSIIYDEYFSVAQNDNLKDNIIYIGGFSKMFSATGLRVGFLGCTEKFMKEIMKVHQYGVSCATSISQWGMVSGLKNSMSDVEKMRHVFSERKDYVVKRLQNMGLEVVNPKGAFYVFPKISKFGLSSEEFADRLLIDKKVACVPGNAFGIGGEGYIRISYCYSMEELKTALDLIEEFIATI